MGWCPEQEFADEARAWCVGVAGEARQWQIVPVERAEEFAEGDVLPQSLADVAAGDFALAVGSDQIGGNLDVHGVPVR